MIKVSDESFQMFEHSYYTLPNGEVKVAEAERNSVFREIFDFIGWRYEGPIIERLESTLCHHCLEEDLHILGLTPQWVGFVYEYLTGKRYSDFVHKSNELNEQIAVEAAVQMVAGIKAAISTLKNQGTVVTSTPMVYNKDTPFGFESHNSEAFLQTLREGLKGTGVQLMEMEEFIAWSASKDDPRH
jgi:hypothetical protein